MRMEIEADTVELKLLSNAVLTGDFFDSESVCALESSEQMLWREWLSVEDTSNMNLCGFIV